ncbi:MAG: DUF4263 domain-containing protein [Bacteroidales bacterium]|nr:DUF4263 domain-containing protein [Bacteroidales bacterium]
MSIQYDKEIFSNNNFSLKVNYSGIKDSVVESSSLIMSVYAYDKTGKPIFSESLNFEQIKSLYEHLNQISIITDSTQTTSGKFIETTGEVIDILNKLNNLDPNILKVVLNKLKNIESIQASLSEVEDKMGVPILENITAYEKFKFWKEEIKNLELLLQLEETGDIVKEIKGQQSLRAYIAGQPEKIFQNWIERNHQWVFGVEYTKIKKGRKIALFSEGDLLMESMDGFLDLIELKRPQYGILKLDKSHKSYYPSSDLSKVIGQCLYYLEKMDNLKMNLEQEHKVKILRPRIKIVLGRTKDFNEEQYNVLRMLNSNLNHIQIISYDYLLSCGEKMISNL